MTPYVSRPTLDLAIAERIGRGAGVYALEGPLGAGKSAALLHGLEAEMERRGPGGRGYVRLVQLWGDEPPSLFARRLVRAATHLHLSSYPEPEKLRLLVETMADAVPGLAAAGRILAALVPDDLRPLHDVAAAALGEIGERAVARGGPLVLGVDLLGGVVADGTRDFFLRLREALPPTVVLLLAQPGGAQSLVPVGPADRIPVGPFLPAEAAAYLRETVGPLTAEDLALLDSGALSLLPGDLAQLALQHRALGANRQAGLRGVAEALARDVAARYEAQFAAACLRVDGDWPAAAELCAWVAMTARPERPLSAAEALRRLEDQRCLVPVELLRLRQHELVRTLCARVTVPTEGAPGATDFADVDNGWPIGPRHADARRGVLQALQRSGLLELYEERWLKDLWPGSLEGGVQALLVLLERAAREPLPALGRAVVLLGELEVHLWRAGWHRTFAELYDRLRAALSRAGLSARDAAPGLWFRRARARVQGVDWTGQGAAEELPRALEELEALGDLSEGAVLAARARLDLGDDGDAGHRVRYLLRKAAQARAYARVLGVLLGAVPEAERAGGLQRALDELLPALAYFAAERRAEDVAQSLTILGDWYSARGDGDEQAEEHYAQAVRLASEAEPVPAFALGIIHRSLGRHLRRRGRPADGAFAEARRWLLRDPGSRMGTLLAALVADPTSPPPT